MFLLGLHNKCEAWTRGAFSAKFFSSHSLYYTYIYHPTCTATLGFFCAIHDSFFITEFPLSFRAVVVVGWCKHSHCIDYFSFFSYSIMFFFSGRVVLSTIMVSYGGVVFFFFFFGVLITPFGGRTSVHSK